MLIRGFFLDKQLHRFRLSIFNNDRSNQIIDIEGLSQSKHKRVI